MEETRRQNVGTIVLEFFIWCANNGLTRDLGAHFDDFLYEKRLIRKHDGYSPWLSKETVQWLDEYLTKNMSILEYGGGNSTIWFAKRVKYVCCWENHHEWSAIINLWLSNEGLNNVDVITEGEPMPNRKFDMVFIDNDNFRGVVKGVGNHHRAEKILEAFSYISPGGIIVLNDDTKGSENVARKILLENGWSRFKKTGKTHPTGFYK